MSRLSAIQERSRTLCLLMRAPIQHVVTSDGDAEGLGGELRSGMRVGKNCDELIFWISNRSCCRCHCRLSAQLRGCGHRPTETNVNRIGCFSVWSFCAVLSDRPCKFQSTSHSLLSNASAVPIRTQTAILAEFSSSSNLKAS